LGPDAGDLGGRLVTEGTPEQIAECEESHTGGALRAHFGDAATQHRNGNFPLRSSEQTCPAQHWNRSPAAR
jgi:hypothetical protein